MSSSPWLGVLLLAIAGLVAGSFYLPFRRVKGWSWESYWIVNGFFSWIVAPWVVCFIAVPKVWSVLAQTPTDTLLWCYGYGVLYGVGGLTFGLAMRYLGMSLGYAIALGFCAAIGTLAAPIYSGAIREIVATGAGQATLAGVIVCLVGIAVCGFAGVAKEKTLPEEEKRKAIKEFSLVKGFWVAVVAGVFSACMNFGILSGKAIGTLAKDAGSGELWTGTPVLIVVLAGTFTTNLAWCVWLNVKNGSGRDYLNLKEIPFLSLACNYFFCAAAGVLWYMQFMFFTMGNTQIGEYSYASWSLLMAFLIIFSNLWGMVLHEWRGAGRRATTLIAVGLAALVLSTVILGIGTYLKEHKKTAGHFVAGNPPTHSI